MVPLMQDHRTTDEPDTRVGWIEQVTRYGWLGKGFVFVVIGALAVRVATNGGRSAGPDANQTGALRAVAGQPLGAVLLVAVGIGLLGFAAWNVLQAVLPASTDADPLGIAKRIGWFGLGAFYGSLAVAALRLALAEAGSPSSGTTSDTESAGSGSSQTQPDALTARLLDAPGGRVVAILISIGILVVAAYHLHKGLTRSFVDDLDTSDLTRRQQSWLGRLGVGASSRGRSPLRRSPGSCSARPRTTTPTRRSASTAPCASWHRARGADR